MKDYQNTNKTYLKSYDKTEVETLQDFSKFYQEQLQGIYFFDSTKNKWQIFLSEGLQREAKEAEVYKDFINSIDAFREYFKHQQEFNMEMITKQLKQIFRVHNQDMLLKIMSVFLDCVEEVN